MAACLSPAVIAWKLNSGLAYVPDEVDVRRAALVLVAAGREDVGRDGEGLPAPEVVGGELERAADGVAADEVAEGAGRVGLAGAGAVRRVVTEVVHVVVDGQRRHLAEVADTVVGAGRVGHPAEAGVEREGVGRDRAVVLDRDARRRRRAWAVNAREEVVAAHRAGG